MTLLILNFETGEPACPYWTIMVTVESSFDGAVLEDTFVNYCKTADHKDLDFEDIVSDVLDSMGWRWNFIDTKIPSCDSAYTLWL